MSSLKTSLAQGLRYTDRFVKGRLQKPTASKENLKPEEGAIIDLNGKKVAAYKKDEGELITLNPVCTHMRCIVDWNSSDKTWDCPCHGSRFEADGTVKQGPAKTNLEKADK